MRLAVCALVIVAVATACGRADVIASAQGAEIDQLGRGAVPSTLTGLRVRQENVKTELEQVQRSYAEAAGLWSLRRADDRVQATLEIVRFFDEPRYTSSAFRRTIVNQIGSSRPTATRMGDHVVYRTTGTKQTVALWFEGRHMMLLAIRDDFAKPRTLIRRALEIGP